MIAFFQLMWIILLIFFFSRSLLLVITGFVVSADGMRVQVFYKRSIGLSDLWNMGFGEANTNEIISYHQANYVS